MVAPSYCLLVMCLVGCPREPCAVRWVQSTARMAPLSTVAWVISHSCHDSWPRVCFFDRTQSGSLQVPRCRPALHQRLHARPQRQQPPRAARPTAHSTVRGGASGPPPAAAVAAPLLSFWGNFPSLGRRAVRAEGTSRAEDRRGFASGKFHRKVLWGNFPSVDKWKNFTYHLSPFTDDRLHRPDFHRRPFEDVHRMEAHKLGTACTYVGPRVPVQ